MSSTAETAKLSPAPHPHPLEWIPVGLEAIFLAILAARHAGTDLLPGQLLPCLALALAPGTAVRLAGHTSITVHRFGIAIGLVTFLFTNGSLDLAQLARLPAAWDLMLPALALVAVIPLAGSLRWRRLLATQGIEVTAGEALRLTLVGHFFNTFIPGSTGGDIFRAYYVARGRGRTGAAISSVILDRFMGLPPLLLLVVIGAISNREFLEKTDTFRPYLWVIMIATGLSILIMGIMLLAALARPERVEKLVEDLPGGRHLRLLIQGLATFRRHGLALLTVFALGLISHSASIGACALIGEAAGVRDIPPERYLLLTPIGLAVNGIPAAPGGLGQGEAAFAKIFYAAAPLEGNDAAGALVMLGFRAALVLCGLVGGGLYVAGRHAIDDACRRALDTEEEPNTAGDSA